MTRVKICGITGPADARRAVDLGAWALGMIFWPGSPRVCPPDEAEAIGAELHRSALLTGVFVNASLDEVAATADRCRLGLLQLHGVTVDGKPVKAPAPARLFRYHKPRGLLTTERDPKGRYLPAERRGLVEGEVFETSSGLKAYVCKVSDPVSISTATVETSERFSLVSLPYVSIQHGALR